MSDRGSHHVEMPYGQVFVTERGMSHGREDVFLWIRENCEQVAPRVVVNMAEGGEVARVMFKLKSEAMLFKLVWGGS